MAKVAKWQAGGVTIPGIGLLEGLSGLKQWVIRKC